MKILHLFGLTDAPAPGAAYSPPKEATTTLGTGVSLKGELKGEGTVVMLGHFEGGIVLDGTLHVGPEARIDANITATAIVVAGAVRGNLSAGTRVEILSTGSLTGTVKSGSFAAADGAVVKGEIWVDGSSDRPELRS
jgi:cytoskeletal protein CcmA (bactofilin family)